MNPQTLTQILNLQKELAQIITTLEPAKQNLPPGMFRELTTAEDGLQNALGKVEQSKRSK